MQTGIEIAIKLVLVGVLIAAALAVWLLPKTRHMTSRAVTGSLFTATAAVGIVSSVAGLLVLFLRPKQVFEWHLWELAALPLVLLYAYWLVIMRRAGTLQVLDEKQDADMTRAAAVTWAVSIPATSLAFVLPDTSLLDGGLWFPCYLFVTLLVFSATTLFYFRR